MNIYDSALEQASREASIIDEVSDNLTYIGYFQNGDSTLCLIKKIEKTATVTTFQFPEGKMSFDQDWAGRAGLTYNFKK